MSFKNKVGVSGMEVLVIISCVLLVQGLIVVGFFGTKYFLAYERDKTRINDVEKISSAIRQYYSMYGSMPVNLAPGRGYCQNEPNFLNELQKTHILDTIPVDPQYPKSYYCYYDYGAGSKYGGYVKSSMEVIKEPAGHCAWTEGNNWCMHNSNTFCKCDPYGDTKYSPFNDIDPNRFPDPMNSVID